MDECKPLAVGGADVDALWTRLERLVEGTAGALRQGPTLAHFSHLNLSVLFMGQGVRARVV